MSASATQTALYVYGVVALRDVPALEQGPAIEVVQEDALAAITRVVSLDEYGEDTLRENLNDREWLEENARAHEDVLLAVAAVADVVPFRFGTICRTADDVRALLAEQRDALTAGLERIRGCAELGVKLWADRDRVEAALSPPQPTAESGRAYLEARRNEQRRAADIQAMCNEVARGAYDRLLRLAVAGVVNRPQPRELTGRTEDMLLNAAFLVTAGDRSITEEVERLDRELRDLGFSVEVTGPWPAHNFVAAEGEAE